MSPIDLDYLRTWVGTSRADEDLISARGGAARAIWSLLLCSMS